MNRFVYVFLMLLFFKVGVSQFSNDIVPVLLDKEALSGIGLEKITLKDTPERDFFQKRLYRGKEISVYVVSSESWTVAFDSFWFDEFIYILQGKGVIHLDDQDDMTFHSGEFFFAPKGFSGKWEVQAGDNYHYELSVITNQRVDSTKAYAAKTPYLLDKSLLSGTDIVWDNNGRYEQTLADGIELKIILKAEQPRTTIITSWPKEQLLCLQSGMISLSDMSGEKHKYYAGDFFVIPKNYQGTWTSDGHSLCKYVVIQKAT